MRPSGAKRSKIQQKPSIKIFSLAGSESRCRCLNERASDLGTPAAMCGISRFQAHLFKRQPGFSELCCRHGLEKMQPRATLSYVTLVDPPLCVGSCRHRLQPGSSFVTPLCQLGTVKTALGMRVLPEIHLLLCGSARCMTQGYQITTGKGNLGLLLHIMKHDLNLAAELCTHRIASQARLHDHVCTEFKHGLVISKNCYMHM